MQKQNKAAVIKDHMNRKGHFLKTKREREQKDRIRVCLIYYCTWFVKCVRVGFFFVGQQLILPRLHPRPPTRVLFTLIAYRSELRRMGQRKKKRKKQEQETLKIELKDLRKIHILIIVCSILYSVICWLTMNNGWMSDGTEKSVDRKYH